MFHGCVEILLQTLENTKKWDHLTLKLFFSSTKDPGQKPFTFKAGLGQVIKGKFWNVEPPGKTRERTLQLSAWDAFE